MTTTTASTSTQPLRLSYSGGPGDWMAVLRKGRKVVAECGHSHRNRDGGHDNANLCGILHVHAARKQSTVDQLKAKAGRASEIARQLGARLTREEAVARVEKTIAAWREVVLAADFHLAPSWTQRQTGLACACCPSPDAQAAVAERARSWDGL